MLGIRQKLSLGFCGLLAILMVVGIWSVSLVTELGGSIDLILRENYRSVIACQQMKESLERMDSGLLFVLLGYEHQGRSLVGNNLALFEEALQVEVRNITLPGEREKAARLGELLVDYKRIVDSVLSDATAAEISRETYFGTVLPLFEQIRATADDILHMNQENMKYAGQKAGAKATEARRTMLGLLLVGSLVAVGFMVLVTKWILRPIGKLTTWANEISSGNLDLVIRVESHDEIGRLAGAFDAMAAGLREFRRTDRARLVRIRRSTEQALGSLPDAVVIADAAGRIELVNKAASESFDIKEDREIAGLPFPVLIDLFYEALRTTRIAEPSGERTLIQRFVNGEERFYRPRAIPILDAEEIPTGVMILLSDATREHHQNELKKGVISTVAHQLRTPLTSVRMALHLLLEEKIGRLNDKQEELAVAAREESDRLHVILEQLLTMSRIESGRAQADRRAVSPHELVFESVEPFRRLAHDRGIALEMALPDDLPEVLADRVLITQALANLLSNALKYTDPGGTVSVSAQASEKSVIFSVSDTGRGIPEQFLEKILEQFFRVPGQTRDTGAGLGLSIVQEIAFRHGGVVNVESTDGKGSTFFLSILRADVPATEESDT